MELTNQQRHSVAMEVAAFWKENCIDEEFYENCRDTVSDQLEYDYGLKFNTKDFDREYQTILKLIDNIYCYDNWQVKKFIDEKFVKGLHYIVQDGYVVVNEMCVYDVWDIDIEDKKMTLNDMNGFPIAAIDIDLIKTFEIIKIE